MHQIEQDLVVCRALVEIFSQPGLADKLAFRGGTALFKLFLSPVRYSDDIDLVQVKPGPIGELLDGLRKALNPWLGTPKWKQTEGRVTFRYRFPSEDGLLLTLKIEINTREHFTVYGVQRIPFQLDSRWFTGSAGITTYSLNELLGTKMRALYQRKKGRDLFDLWYAFLESDQIPVSSQVVSVFLQYMEHGGHQISRAMFEQNLFEKKDDAQFRKDIEPLLVADNTWNFDQAFAYVIENLIVLIPGDHWRGGKI
ncbi:MAG: nucleotidyl transferase AbiEii/AbiGii toxin family protein [Pseudomonadota bacterium]|nr:nucleotidyl transferase AbiEii/AbiGii toxin family protein [Pseudomonadota bacterium]